MQLYYVSESTTQSSVSSGIFSELFGISTVFANNGLIRKKKAKILKVLRDLYHLWQLQTL